MKKKSKKLKVSGSLYSAIMHELGMMQMKLTAMENRLAALAWTQENLVAQHDYDQDKLWYTKRLDEMESKLSIKFYHYTEIMPKLRSEFGRLLTELDERLRKCEENEKI